MTDSIGIKMNDEAVVAPSACADDSVGVATGQEPLAPDETNSTDARDGAAVDSPQAVATAETTASATEPPAAPSLKAPEPSDAADAETERKIYTQSEADERVEKCVAEWQGQVNQLQDEAKRNKADADDYKNRCARAEDHAKRKDEIMARYFEKMGGNYSGRMDFIYNLVSGFADAQLDNEEKDNLSKWLKEKEALLSKANTDCGRLTDENGELKQRNVALSADLKELKASVERLGKDMAEKDAELSRRKEELERWQSAGNCFVDAMIPDCLKDKPWFSALRTELQDSTFGADSPSDAAMLVLASLAELAVMERSPTGACFDWTKQLSDVGLVLASYLHQKKKTEGDVLTTLRNFAQAFQEIPNVKKDRIVIKLPALGGDFNTDEVRHRTNGKAVAKVLNWCIVENGSVYCKAIVE